ncbi:MAG: pentapeptide repeat-containing protein [Nitrospiraceae bacterium]
MPPQLCVALCLSLLVSLLPLSVQAACVPLEQPPNTSTPTAGKTADLLFRHLPDSCTNAERETQAVPAAEILAALKSGKGIDLSGVVVTGDLLLDELPTVPVDRLSGVSESVTHAIKDLGGNETRVIRGPFSIQRSRVSGRIASRLAQGSLVVLGPHRLVDTEFGDLQDWSRTVFAAGFDWSGARFHREALAVRAQVVGEAVARKTHFGPHTRFHQSRFFGPVTFDGAQFNGLAEFLEVAFDQPVSFAKTVFAQGTGFSGSRFGSTVTFSGAHFLHEVFFPFAQFTGAARFDEARFDGPAEFGKAHFAALAAFDQAWFQVLPQWTTVTFQGERRLPTAAGDGPDLLQYVILLGTLGLALALFWLVLRR